jgi:hypothetical protein
MPEARTSYETLAAKIRFEGPPLSPIPDGVWTTLLNSLQASETMRMTYKSGHIRFGQNAAFCAGFSAICGIAADMIPPKTRLGHGGVAALSLPIHAIEFSDTIRQAGPRVIETRLVPSNAAPCDESRSRRQIPWAGDSTGNPTARGR